MIANIEHQYWIIYASVIGLQIAIFSGVGKTSLIGRYIGNFDNVSPTIGASFFNCKLNLGDMKIKLHVWL